MKLGMELPVWLDRQDYFDKTVKFLKYYTSLEVSTALGLNAEDIWLVDNASSIENITKIAQMFPKVRFKCYTKHYQRTAHLEYPFCWRGLYFCRELFQEYDYDQIIHLNNDVYIISEKLCNYLRDYKSGWWSPYCNRHKFPECDVQLITKDCTDYWNVTAMPYLTHNGKHMEHVMKAKVEKNWVGDRWGEMPISKQQPGWDFACQTRLHMEIKFNV